MSEVLTAPRVLTGDQMVTAGAVVIGDHTLHWVGPARGRDYLPDSGRFDVSAPGTPFASPDHAVDLRLLTEATKRRQA